MNPMFLTILLGALTGMASAAPSLYHEIVLPLNKNAVSSIVTDEDKHSVIIHLENVNEADLEALSFYDERLVESISIKNEGERKYNITIQLRKKARASVAQLAEPKRMVFSFFDHDYMQARDPVTQLPLSGLGDESTIEAAQVPHEEAQEGESLQLLQPELERVVEPHELDLLISGTPRGRGRQWARYPPYIYPFTIGPYQGRMTGSHGQAQSPVFPLIEQAIKLYGYGDERQALALFQHVLFKDPTLFNQDPLYAWAYAECHFGDGNLTLSDSYYSTLHGTFPSSPFARLSLIRRVDVAALTLISADKYAELPKLIKNIAALPISNQEVFAQGMIRQAFWSRAQPQDQRTLPVVSETLASDLEKTVEHVESKRTGFLAQAIVLKHLLQQVSPWTEHSISLTNSFFSNYANVPDRTFLVELNKDLEAKLAALLQKKSEDGFFIEVVSTFESLPKAAEAIAQIPSVAWAVGEAYRNLQKYADALPLYKTVAEKETAEQKRFYALFWSSFLAAETAQVERLANRAERAELLEKDALAADKRLFDSWESLEDSEKSLIKTTYRQHFEEAVKKTNKMQSAPLILLSSLKEELGREKKQGEAPAAASKEGKGNAQVRLIHLLGERFAALGQGSSRREALSLLRKLTPKDFPEDGEAHQLWTANLIALADDYRRENQFLDAGRIYTYTAENAEDWDRRAEVFYKGGLLLFRAGRRDASIEALTAASQDGNNFFYANLAKERLTTLQR
ncbi:MAG: hypothetical protein HYW48_12150 [Deltaproteobacteria bacterium]|nr:hypothetical protein [Deltaproteobacteria bacterium]